MKRPALPCSFASNSTALALLLGTLALVGCGGVTSFPDAVVNPQVQGPVIEGSIYGGHAPIVGSHLYVLQPGTSGIGSASTSLLTGTSADGGRYPLSTNTATGGDPNVPVGAKYVTSDANGAWNITGAYSCTANEPVYLYSYGGHSPSTQPSTTEKAGSPTLTTADISQIVVSNAVVNSATGTATYAITLNSTDLFTSGESVTIAGLTGNLAVLNGTQTVLVSPAPTNTTFSVTANDSYGWYVYIGFFPNFVGGIYFDSVGEGVYTASSGPPGDDAGGNFNGQGQFNFGTNDTTGVGPFGAAGTAAGVTTPLLPTTSPVVELAVLGVCPSSGNFSTGSTALKFVYMNEVSTVAAAYVFQPFTSASNNNAWDVGSSGTTQGLAGINNAALTAAQLYDIQGSLVSTTNDGEGHVANLKTVNAAGTPNAGTGTVPQTKLDSLGNILAMCVDSTPGSTGLISAPCNTLFNTATDDGTTTGTQPTDIATAAINIARYPAGNHTGSYDPTYASDINGVVSGTVPYAPNLGTTAPNDWTIAITYTGGGIGVTGGTSPHSIAVDGNGNIFSANFNANTFSEFSPLGIPANASGFGTGLNGPDSVAIDSASAKVWLANFGNSTVSHCTTAGVCAATALGKTQPGDAEIDASGNVWVSSKAQNALVEVSGSSFAVLHTITTNLSAPRGVAIDPGVQGDIWVADSGANESSQCTQGGMAGFACTTNTHGGIHAPTGVAIDGASNAWFTDSNGNVSAVNNAGNAITGSPYNTGSGSALDGVAIDGLGNAWVTNPSGFALYELSLNGGAISQITPTTGYKSSASYQPDGVAIDASGNVWYNTSNQSVLVELVGAASPVVTPLSTGVSNTTLGTNP